RGRGPREHLSLSAALDDVQTLGDDPGHVLASVLVVVRPDHNVTVVDVIEDLCVRDGLGPADGAECQEPARGECASRFLAFAEYDALIGRRLAELVDAVERQRPRADSVKP